MGDFGFTWLKFNLVKHDEKGLLPLLFVNVSGGKMSLIVLAAWIGFFGILFRD